MMSEYDARPTVTILAGNSDDRLTQQLWSEMIAAIREIVVFQSLGGNVMFEGFTDGAERWQTACWVIVLPDDPFVPSKMRDQLRGVAHAFEQQSILWVQADQIVYLSGEPS
jgi:hypothetical protein